MIKREISDLDIKLKLTKEYLDNGGIKKIKFRSILDGLIKVKIDKNGKVDPNTVNPVVNAFMLSLLASHLTPPNFSKQHLAEYASTLQKSSCFDQDNIDTIEHFNRVYDEYRNTENILFRGQREAMWRLHSKLQRQWINEKLFLKKRSYQKFIEQLVEIGRVECGSQIKELLKANHIDTENPVSILGYLQHHGCPTPLLDWTYSFQNALFFSLDGLTPNNTTYEIQNYFSVYYIEEKHFEGGNLRTIINEGLSRIEKPMLLDLIAKIAKDEKTRLEMEERFGERSLFDKSKLSGSGLISHMTSIEKLITFSIAYFSDKDTDSGILFSLNNSKNILNQAGVFTWNSDSSKPLEMLGDENYTQNIPNEDNGYKFCSCFNIHKNLADHVRKRLEADGITKEFIYPTPELSTWSIFEKCLAE
jgi:hypothetical protein